MLEPALSLSLIDMLVTGLLLLQKLTELEDKAEKSTIEAQRKISMLASKTPRLAFQSSPGG